MTACGIMWKMIKEYLIAIVLGCLLGFGITGGYYNLKSGQKSSPTPIDATPTATSDNNDSSSTKDSSNQNVDTSSSSLIVTTPENHTIVNNSKLTIEGSATPQSTIIINTPVDSYITDNGKSGDFELKVDIESGFNLVQIVSIDSEDNQSEIELIITYSTAKI